MPHQSQNKISRLATDTSGKPSENSAPLSATTHRAVLHVHLSVCSSIRYSQSNGGTHRA